MRYDLYLMFFDYFVKTGMAQDRAARHADRLADKIVNELTRTAMRQLQEQRELITP